MSRQGAAAAQAPKPQVWTPAQSRAMKRQALLDCVLAAQARYSQPWARTSVDLAIQARTCCACSNPKP